MQDVFIKVMERLPALREPVAFPGWLMAIARRTAIDYQRGAKTTTELRECRANAAQPDGEAFAVMGAIQRLPESYRETLILRLVEGTTGPEIAARTGLTPDSVRVNLCCGTKLPRALLEGEDELWVTITFGTGAASRTRRSSGWKKCCGHCVGAKRTGGPGE